MTTQSDGFPLALLARPAAERLAYFSTKVIAHPHLKAVHDAVLQASRPLRRSCLSSDQRGLAKPPFADGLNSS